MLRALGAHEFPGALARLVQAWKTGNTRALDAVLLEVADGPAAGRRISLVIWGLGLVAEVTRLGLRLRCLGAWAYTVGGAGAALAHRPFTVKLTVDGEERESCLDLLAVSNCPYAGGGMRVAPGLRLDDGRMQLLTARIPSRLGLLGAMAAIRRGEHEGRAGIQASYVREVRVAASVPLPMTLDGDLFTARAARLTPRPGFFRLMFAPEPE